jgi:glutamine phosphoribosylpyrophosphate amidotransferase
MDPKILDECLTGLIKNAIENTPDEGMIRIILERKGHWTQLKVMDFGIGITSSSDIQPLKFDTCIGSFNIVVQGNFQNLQKVGDDLKKQGSNFREKTWDEKTGTWIYRGPRDL